MRLGLNVGYWGMSGSGEDSLALVQEAERLGYTSVWMAEQLGRPSPSRVVQALAG